MKCLAHPELCWLPLLASLIPFQSAQGQAPGCLQELSSPIDFSRNVKITILRVEFPRELLFTEPVRTKLEKEIRGQDISTAPEAPDSDWWVENQVDWRIREELQSQGYFKANVHSRPHLVLATANEQQYIVAVEAEPGPQYRLHDLQFKNVSAVGPDELGRTFPLHPGDTFDVSKIRHGFESIEKLYGQLGYIDATVEPEIKVDEQNDQIDLVVNIDEQKQYRLGKFEVVGLDSKAAKSLESRVEPGQIFNRASLEALFQEQRDVLPANSSLDRNGQISRNVKDGTIDIVLDFRPCPQT